MEHVLTSSDFCRHFSRSIDTSEALLMPGVVDTVSVQDVPGTNEFYTYDDPDIIFAREKVDSCLIPGHSFLSP